MTAPARTLAHAQQVRDILSADPARCELLECVYALQLPDCWGAAGFVRNGVWDFLHDRACQPVTGDVDVIWYDPTRATPEIDQALEARLRGMYPKVDWSVKNQARMHVRNHDRPYTSSSDAMRHWPETATAVAARRQTGRCIEVCAPLGLEDLFALVLRPTSRFAIDKHDIYKARSFTKAWETKWPQLTQAGSPAGPLPCAAENASTATIR